MDGPVSHFGRRSLKFKGPQLWNRLPNELTDITSSNSFSKTVTQCNSAASYLRKYVSCITYWFVTHCNSVALLVWLSMCFNV